MFFLDAPGFLVILFGIPMLALLFLWIHVVKERLDEIRSGEEDDLSNTDYELQERVGNVRFGERKYHSNKEYRKRYFTGFKTLVGGELKAYNEMMNEARALATKRMVEEAEAMGADAVVNIRYASSAIMGGAAEVIAYGTAVKFI